MMCGVYYKSMQRLNEWDNQEVRTIAIGTTMLAGCARMSARVAVGCFLLSVGCCILAVAALFFFHRCDLVFVLSMFVRIYYLIC